MPHLPQQYQTNEWPGPHKNTPTPPHKQVSRHHPHEEHIIGALYMLLHASKLNIKTVEDLAMPAESYPGGWKLAGILRSPSFSNLSPQEALAQLANQIGDNGNERFNEILSWCSGTKIGVMLPLPPHILDVFMAFPDVQILNSGGHHLPPHLDHRRFNILSTAYECRNTIAQLNVIILELCIHRDGYYVTDPATSDIIDPRVMMSSTKLVGHVRPHSHHWDVPLNLDAAVRVVLL
jgi:hypothetical protein